MERFETYHNRRVNLGAGVIQRELTCKHKYSKYWTIGVKMLLCFYSNRDLFQDKGQSVVVHFSVSQTYLSSIHVFGCLLIFVPFSGHLSCQQLSNMMRASPARYDWTEENNRPEGGSAYTLAGEPTSSAAWLKKISQSGLPCQESGITNGMAYKLVVGC